MKKTKKTIGLLISFMLLIALMVSCASTSKVEEKETLKSETEKSKESNPVTIKLATELSTSHPTYKAVEYFKKIVEEKSNGEITVELFPDGQLGGSRDVLEGMGLGTVDATLVSAGPLAQFVPELDVLSLPYIFSGEEHMHAVLDGVPSDIMAEFLAKKGFVHLAWTDAGSRNMLNNIRPIYTPNDLKGVKTRVMDSQIMIDTINYMGGIATPLSYGEVYSALQQDVIDGWENNPPSVLSSKLYEVSEYFSWTKHFMVPDALIFSNKTFDKLTTEQQKLIKECGKEMTVEQRKLYADFEVSAVEKLKELGLKFNDVKDIDTFVEAVKPVWSGYTDRFGTELIDEIQSLK